MTDASMYESMSFLARLPEGQRTASRYWRALSASWKCGAFRLLIMKLTHWSDCAIYRSPAYPAGECDCGVVKAGKRFFPSLYHSACILASHWRIVAEAWLFREFRFLGKAAA